MSERTVADALAEGLRRHGVTDMFGQSLPSALFLATPQVGHPADRLPDGERGRRDGRRLRQGVGSYRRRRRPERAGRDAAGAADGRGD